MRGESRYERIYAVIRRIPPGRVATYGQIAALAGLPGAARQVGYALHALRAGSGVPWHRVVNAKGHVSLGDLDPDDGAEQRIRLEIEGIAFDSEGRIDLKRYRWRGPRPSVPSRRGGTGRTRRIRP